MPLLLALGRRVLAKSHSGRNCIASATLHAQKGGAVMAKACLLPGGAMNRRLMLFGITTAAAIPRVLGYTRAQAQTSTDFLASWNDRPAKRAILDFVRTITDRSSGNFVAPEDRIATFGQDGTLRVEHPLSPQAAFAVDRVHKTATQHPEWQKREPFRSVLADDSAAMASLRERDWAKIIFTTTAGMSQAEFLRVVDQWLATAKHPRFDRFYTELVYQPMREVIEYLRINSFKIYVVTGELQEFVRVFARRAYGIPPEQVIGTMIDERYQIKNGKPELIKVPRFFFYGGQSGKAIGIDLFIGERPYAAFGNSTGDRQMLEWTDAGNGARLEMLILHDDRQREYAYGPVRGVPNTQGGTLDDPLLEEASSRGWTVISMKDDWKRIFSFE